MNDKLFQSLENDIIIKEKILENYENNLYNYQSIQNFNNLEIKTNDKYEKILDDIVEKNKDKKLTENNLIDSVLSPLYYSMMINNNQDFNENINKLLNTKIANKKLENKDNSFNSDINSKNNININEYNNKKNNNLKKNNNNSFDSEKSNYKEKNKVISYDENIDNIEFNHNEIINIKQEKGIYNMIVLKSGNIAISTIENVMIYNTKELLSQKEENYLLQTIKVCKNKKVSYVYEFPNETLFISIYSKIFHLKLIDNDTSYNVLGIIRLQKYELPSKLISLGDSYLVVMTVKQGKSFVRLFIKNEEFGENYENNLYSNNNNEQDNYNSNNSEDQSAGILSDWDYLDKKVIEKEKEFYPYSNNNSNNNNININDALLTSIFEIKKKNKLKNEFITTSNSVFDKGQDKVCFYEVKYIDKNLEINYLKKLDNISCSTEADSICQLNKSFICIGLQKHKENQINGFAIISISKRDINKIINDLPIYSLTYNFEKKILYSAMDFIENGSKKHYYLITIFKVIEGIGEIYLSTFYQFKSEHRNIVVSLSEIKEDMKEINESSEENNEESDEEENEKNTIFLASSSIDATLRINKININN